MSNLAIQSDDQWLDDVLAAFERWATKGGFKHEKMLTRLEAKTAIRKQLLEARQDELINSYNHNFIHWGDNLAKAKLDIIKRLSELQTQLKQLEGEV